MSSINRVKLFYGIIYGSFEKFEAAVSLLSEYFGEIDFIGSMFPFDKTDYYEKEMGSPLYRTFASVKRLACPDELVGAKKVASDIEKRMSSGASRIVNLDPGYIDFSKVVLASGKYAPHKLYLFNGVYADMTLSYGKGKFKPFDWTFPDFRDVLYDSELLKIRNLYKEQLNNV